MVSISLASDNWDDAKRGVHGQGGQTLTDDPLSVNSITYSYLIVC